MDDLKLYASTKDHLNRLLEITKFFSDDIKMIFGIDKCKTIAINKGKLKETNTEEIFSIGEMKQGDLYKYLGVAQSNRINQKKMKEKLINEVIGRIHKLAKSQLNGKNLFKAINAFAIPVLTYSFGIVKWSDTELQAIQRKMRTTLTKHQIHHPKACKERMVLPRRLGGRGLMDIHLLHDNQIEALRKYFNVAARTSDLIQAIVTVDETYTPLKLGKDQVQRTSKNNNDKLAEWSQKAIHGKYYYSLQNHNVDVNMSHRWLTNGSIYSETEGFMLAIQDEVIATRNYQRYVMKIPDAAEDKCRRCGGKGETIDHIISACPVLTQSDYLKRHNNVAKIIYMEILNMYNITTENQRYYLFDPEAVVENSDIKIYYDRTIFTVHRREHNRPDITIILKKQQKAYLIDVAIPLSRNMEKTYNEKISKYAELAVEIKSQWNLKNVQIVPIIMSSIGIVHNKLKNSLEQLNISHKLIEKIQKAVIIDTCHIVRKFMQ